jgi:hypothetical protein
LGAKGCCGGERGDMSKPHMSQDLMLELIIEGFKAQERLLACYRLGKRPSEKIFTAIAKAKSAIAIKEEA